jgi:3-hydroxy-5-methyl-1-naphthoate 3-O-methyltransferase
MPAKSRSRRPSPLPLMQLATSFWMFKTLAVAEKLDLFGLAARARGLTSATLAAALDIDERPAEMLLTGCAALGLLRKQSGRYRNTPLADTYLVRGQPYSFGGLIAMLDQRLYPAWGRLEDAIRRNRPTSWDPDTQQSLFDGQDPVMLRHFWEAMHAISSSTGAALARAVNFKPFRRVLDVGGGSGAIDIELCKRHRHLRSTVYDLPHVAEIAAAKVAAAGLGNRIDTAGGDFFADASYPPGHDVIVLSLIMHDWSEADDRRILQRCYEALPSGGAVLICELLVNDEKTGPAASALMSLNMLVETTGGRNYSGAEYKRWLKDIGFRKLRTVRLNGPGADGVVMGVKP